MTDTPEDQPQQPVGPGRLIKLREVMDLTGLRKTMIYRMIREDRFPRQYKPGDFASRWDEAEVLAWREASRPQTKAA